MNSPEPTLPPPAPDTSGAAPESGADEAGRPEALPDSVLARMKADPAHAPEYLALAAVERFGPEAALWAAHNRAAYPTVRPEAWAHLIRTRYVRLSKYSGAVAGAAGAVGAVFDVGVLAWNQARMVIHIAAAYGLDPTHSDRAADLLVLRGIKAKLDVARTAVDVVRRQEEVSTLVQQFTSQTKAYSVLAWELARMAGMTAAKRVAMKFVPFAGVPLGAIANASATNQLADKAIAYYAASNRHPAIER
jgi:uncharacterized protein (DUF697 family)